ncbi:unnamed protein product [Prorocentrum cordatum]|uniref:Non-specific serine/threonine protein kinase n=1 Tax=Prorocentrum cordatum TaxID=2364126 RepID=A0ABN9W185_9DINO|nr:unnamed protein product [Polarella glacialis]
MPVDLMAQALCGAGEPHGAEQVVMQTWDFAGQDMYYGMAHVFLTSRGIYVLALDLSAWAGSWSQTGPPSQELVDSVDFWLAAILVHAPSARFVIVGTHDDAVPAEDRGAVRRRVDAHLASRLEAMPSLHHRLHANAEEQLLFFPVDNSRQSPAAQRGVDRLREALNRLALELVRDTGCIPTRWAHLLHVLAQEEAGGAGRPYIGLEECRRLAAQAGVGSAAGAPEDLQAFLGLFHSLGQLLYFPGSPAVVLSPQWLLDAMAHVVACRRVLPRARALLERGVLSPELLAALWEHPRDPQHLAPLWEHRETLVRFLEHFDLLVPSPVAAAEPASPEAVICLDFQGGGSAADGPTGVSLRVLQKVFQDAAEFSLSGAALPPRLARARSVVLSGAPRPSEGGATAVALPHPVIVALDTFSAQSLQIMRVQLRGLPSVGAGETVKAVLELFGESLHRWLPRLSFAGKVACPCCQAGAAPEQCGAMGHLLDLGEVLSEDALACPYAGTWVEDRLPPALREWRASERSARAPPGPAAAAGPSSVRVSFLYASPISPGGEVPELDIAGEVQALRDLPGVALDVRVATLAALREASLSTASVLHLSAHCSHVDPSTHCALPRLRLLLENSCGGVHSVGEEELVAMGPWDRQGTVLVFLACGSKELADTLVQRCGLRCAICCSEEVQDRAARWYCRGLYHALGVGLSVERAHQAGREAIRSSPDPGLRSEADKFELLGAPGRAGGSMLAPGPTPAGQPRWPLWSMTEDYCERWSCKLGLCRHFEHRRVAVLTGPAGVGKTAFCREFCRYYSAPGGRFFSAGALWVDRARVRARAGEQPCDALARAVLDDLAARGAPPGAAAPAAAARSPWDAFRLAAQRLDEAGPWLVVVDGLEVAEDGAGECDEACLAEALDAALRCAARLHLLLAARRSPRGAPWGSLAGAKAVPLELPPLPPLEAAELFLKRLGRHLFECDFDPRAPPWGSGREAPVPKSRHLLERLAVTRLLHALGNLPGRVVTAARLVTPALPSLLEHPALPQAWPHEAAADA